MRKINKIMMITVSILLTLVLITSSVVSGTFAKYASSGQSSATARVAKWGAVVEITANRPEGVTGTDGDAIIFSTDALKMAPGSNFSDVVELKFSGTAEVRLKVKITATVNCVDSKIAIPASVAGKDTCFIPMGITIKENKNDTTFGYLSNPWLEKTSTNGSIATELQNAIAKGFEKEAGFTANGSTAEKEFAPNDPIEFTLGDKVVSSFHLGFEWPSGYTNNATPYEYSKIAAHIMGNFPDDANIGITYTVTVEQVR